MNSSFSCRLAFITGGAGSGKSALAERLCRGRSGSRLYVATMQPHGQEALARIERHRAARAGGGFDTVEIPHSLESLHLSRRYRTALLEDLGNLAANQIFAAGTPAPGAAERIFTGLHTLGQQVDALVVVSNEIFCGAERFSGETENYLRCLADLHCALARRAALVVESVCGLPQVLRGEWDEF